MDRAMLCPSSLTPRQEVDTGQLAVLKPMEELGWERSYLKSLAADRQRQIAL